MTYTDKIPFSDIVSKFKRITSAGSDFMITRCPWQPGAGKYYTVRKAIVTPVSGTVNTVVTFWDKDLSSATPAVRGDASTGSIICLVPSVATSGGALSLIIGETQMPPHRFEAGISCQSSTINTHIMLELELH